MIITLHQLPVIVRIPWELIRGATRISITSQSKNFGGERIIIVIITRMDTRESHVTYFMSKKNLQRNQLENIFNK